MATTVQEDAAFEELLFAEALVSSDLSSRVFRPVKKDERTERA